VTTQLENLLNEHRTLVMGVVNVTPDSFSDGGRFFDTERAVEHGMRLAEEGASILDVGGESTAPNSLGVDADEECRRVLPVIERLAAEGLYVSVDTYKGPVARRAVEAGALMVNDVTALRGDRELPPVLENSVCDVCLMYAKDQSARTTAADTRYEDVVSHIVAFLSDRIAFAESCGIDRRRIVVDPGMGAFVSAEPGPSLRILGNIEALVGIGRPVLVGASRKGFIGKVLGVPLDDRLEGSLACAAVASYGGARIIRAHDVKATVRVVRMVDAIVEASSA
jgi:dihydropteroate synthase